jgi:hypothetical protein
VVDGLEFRSVTVLAYEGKQGEQGERRDHGQAVIYHGTFTAVLDADQHVFPGRRPRYATRARTALPLGQGVRVDIGPRLR